jgi:hypothetical protein
MISPVFIAGIIIFAIVMIAGYIIAKKKQIKLKWWFPLAVIAIIFMIKLIASFLLHFVFKNVE